VGQLVTVAKVGDVREGESIIVEVNKKDVAIFFVGGKYYAIDDMCPHAGASLSGGTVEDGIVTCPWHAWRFRLTDGAWADNPRVKTGCYQVHVVGEDVQLELPTG
jgi:nitrite reductase (NADH) small subunit